VEHAPHWAGTHLVGNGDTASLQIHRSFFGMPAVLPGRLEFPPAARHSRAGRWGNTDA